MSSQSSTPPNPDRIKKRLYMEIDQLREEVYVTRERTSTTAAELLKYVMEHQKEDPLITGEASSTGPYVEKKHCSIL